MHDSFKLAGTGLVGTRSCGQFSIVAPLLEIDVARHLGARRRLSASGRVSFGDCRLCTYVENVLEGARLEFSLAHLAPHSVFGVL